MSALRIAIIGCGKQAPKHISGLRSLGNIDLILADLDANAARALGDREKCPWTSDIEGLFSDRSILAVDLCTPTPTHAPLATKAIQAGKDFLCEKPLCETSEEARRIQTLAAAHERIGMIGYIYRFAPIFQQCHRILTEDKALGRPVSAFFRIGGRGSHQVWKHRRAAGGGAMKEMFVHMLDLAIWFFGDVEGADLLVERLMRPQRMIRGIDEAVDAEDYIVVRLQMSGGVEVLIQADMLTPAFSQVVEIQGENGTFMGSIQPTMPSFLHCDQAVAAYDKGKTELAMPPTNLFLQMMSEFVAAVQSREAALHGRIEDSVKILEVLEALDAQRKSLCRP